MFELYKSSYINNMDNTSFSKKNKFYFSDFRINQPNFTRKYTNNWNELCELCEFVGFNNIDIINIDIIDNELVLINKSYRTKPLTEVNYKILRIMTGIAGLSYSN